jgi:putative endonuclease
MKGYVYILENVNSRFYIGSTSNIDRRMKQHELGHTQTTRNMKKYVLVLKQEFDTLAIARKVELRLKNLKRKDYIRKIISDGYTKIR